MSKNYQTPSSRAAESGLALPEAVTVTMAEIAESAKEGLLALAVRAGLQVMSALMETDVTVLAGPRGKHDPDRTAVPLLGRMALERMLAGLSTRRYPVGLEPVGEPVEATASATSKSAVSRKFVAATERALAELLAAPLGGLDLVALMVDGVHFTEHCCVVALGIGIDGIKHPLALAEGSTENATLVRDLLADLRERGLDVTRPMLVVIDGSKALRRAVLDVFDAPGSSAASSTSSGTFGTNCRSGCGPRWNGGCARPTTPPRRWTPKRS